MFYFTFGKRNQVQLFLKNHPEFKFVKENKVSAHKSGFDGFYMALLEKVS